MSFSESLNGGMTIFLAVASILTSFILPAELSVILLLLSYPTAVYASGLTTGNDDGDSEGALSFFWKLLTITLIVFAIIYWRYGLLQQGEQVDVSLLEATYFSVTTFTTLGYGDFAPIPRIRHITSIQALLGYVALGLWVGLINRRINGLEQMRMSIGRHNKHLIQREDKKD